MYPSERVDNRISKDTAEELGMSLSLVEQVIRFQFKTANEATAVSTSVELTDLGTFRTPKTKVERKLKTFKRKLQIKQALAENSELTDRKRNAAMLASKTVEDNIDYLNKKMKAYED